MGRVYKTRVLEPARGTERVSLPESVKKKPKKKPKSTRQYKRRDMEAE